MARITKYLLLALIVAVAFNHAARAQEEEAPAAEAEAEPAPEVAPEEEAPAAAEEEAAPAAAEGEAEPSVGSALVEEEDNFSLGSIKKVGSWLSKFGWWNIWKGIGLKKAGDWWKWDKIFKEDWWKKKWFLLGSPLEEESRMMLVLSEPEARSSMGINAGEEDATYFLAPPGFENELAKRGIAVNPSIVPVSKPKKKHYQQQQRPRQQQPHQRPPPQQYLQQQDPRQLQNTQYPQTWLQRAFPALDLYDREGGQGSEIDSVRVRPNSQSLSRSMVASLKQQIPDIIPLGSSVPNTPMYAYDKNGVMQLIQQKTPTPTRQHQYQMMNEDIQNPAVLQEYQQARTGFQEIMGKPRKPQLTKTTRSDLEEQPEELIVPMPFPRSNSITTKEEIERALNDEQTQKMLEQYARKNWKTIRKDAIILKFLPKTDMEARPSVKRQATMTQEQMPMQMPMLRQMTGDHLPEEINSAYARDFHQWTAQQERAMQQQQLRQMTQPQMQEPIEEIPHQIMQQRPMTQQAIMTPQEPRQMMTQAPQQMPMIQQKPHQMPMIQQQEPRQSFHDQTPAIQQQPIMQQQIPFDQHEINQQEPRQWLQEQPMIQQMPRQWIQEQPHQQQNIMVQQETMPQSPEPRQWVQEQQWTSVDPSVLDQMKPRQMTHHALDQTQIAEAQQALDSMTASDGAKLENKDDQHPIVSEMGPQTEDNARFFKKALLKKKLSPRPQYVTHNYNIYSSDGGHGSGGYGGGYGGVPSYGGGSGYGGASSHSYGSSYGGSSGYGGGYGSSGYGSSPSGSYGGHSYSSPSYGGGHGGYSSGHGGSYGGGHSGGYRSADMEQNPMTQYQPQDPNPYRSSNALNNHPILQSHVDESTMLSNSQAPSQNQQSETNPEDHLSYNERTATTTTTVADEASRLASKPNLSHIHSNRDYRFKTYRSKRQVSELGSKKVSRSRRSILSLKNHLRSRRQVSYGGGQSYSSLESIPPSSLQKLREGYKENLKEITLQPNEDPAEALMRLNSQSIQEALYRASSEPIEVDGTPGHTVVHNEGMGQPIIQNQGPSQAHPISNNNYQSQWAPQTPLYTVENVRAPMMFNSGNFYPDSTQNATVQNVPSNYGVQQYGSGNPEQNYGNRPQQSVGMMVTQGRPGEPSDYERPIMNQHTVPQRYDAQFQNPVLQPQTQVLNNPSYFYQQPNIPQVQYQVQSAPVENYNQYSATPVANYNQYSPPRLEVSSAPIGHFGNQFLPPQPVVPSTPIRNYNQLLGTRSDYQAPMQYFDPIKETAEAAVRDYLGGQLVKPSTNSDSVSDLMETIKNRLTNCCHKCKKQILKGINSGIASENEQKSNGDDPEEECLTCKESAELLSDLKSLQSDFFKNSTPKPTSRSYSNHENAGSSKSHKNENTFRYYRDPNAINRQKSTQAMWTKKSSSRADEEKENLRDHLNKQDEDFDYDYNLEGEYDREPKTQSHRSNQERSDKRLTTRPTPRDYLENDHLQRSGYSHKSRTQTSKPLSRPGYSSSNQDQEYSGDYEKRRPQENHGYRRVSDAQGQRRLTTRSGPKENKSSGYSYEKQMKHENYNKNSANTQTPNSVRVRKPKVKPVETNNDSPCKKIQKQLKELESETRAARLDNDDDKHTDILVEKKAKLIELLYFLYEMSKCSLGEQCQKTGENVDEVSSTTVPSITKEASDSSSMATQSRRVKIPRKKDVKILDYSTVNQGENSKKVRCVDNNYSGEDW